MMLALALLLDAALGEPRWLWSRVPHPVVLIGWMISGLERRLNTGADRRRKGIVALGVCLALTGFVALLPRLLPFGWVVEIAGAAVLLAHRSLIDHVAAVADGLRQSLDGGRSAVAMIVGRDPGTLDEPGVARAAIESAAENFSDGVVAPAFWFLIAGLPGIAIYKAINTADSMIGHRTERYREFGWAAARLDDLANWVPARLAGFLLCTVGGGAAAFGIMFRDAPRHRSPNAGWPEAAMAASLDVSVSGPRAYDGVLTDDPFVNAGGRAPAAEDIDAACRLLWFAWGALLVVTLLLAAI